MRIRFLVPVTHVNSVIYCSVMYCEVFHICDKFSNNLIQLFYTSFPQDTYIDDISGYWHYPTIYRFKNFPQDYTLDPSPPPPPRPTNSYPSAVLNICCLSRFQL